MISKLKNSVRSFLQGEDGSMVVPFALWTPIIITLMVSSIEMGTMTIRHAALERSLDQTVRHIRLNPGETFTHPEIKQMVCDKSVVLSHCAQTLHLEMIVLSMTNYTDPDSTPDCVDVAQTVTPVRAFQNGTENEVLFIRACYKYDPVSPAGFLGGAMTTDANGFVGLITTNSFVIEPS